MGSSKYFGEVEILGKKECGEEIGWDCLELDLVGFMNVKFRSLNLILEIMEKKLLVWRGGSLSKGGLWFDLIFLEGFFVCSVERRRENGESWSKDIREDVVVEV